MSAKRLDRYGRWRNLTIAFRVSPQENEDLNMRVKLSGLTKQDYITRRCLERDVVVQGNPRVYKALKTEMQSIHEQLLRISKVDEISDELWSRILMVASTFKGLGEETSPKERDLKL